MTGVLLLRIVSELKLIREALERAYPPPDDEIDLGVTSPW